MEYQVASFDDLFDLAMTWPKTLEMRIETAKDAAKPGFHLTQAIARCETSVDCGGSVAERQLSVLQFLDGFGDDPMTAGTFQKILKQSIAAIPELRHGHLQAEFGLRNVGLNNYSLERIEVGESFVVLHLRENMAVCTPMMGANKNARLPRPDNTIARQSVCCG